LFIDDLQWGDEDSADLLADLIKRGTTALLFVAGYRTDEADSSPLLRRLTSLRTGLGGTLLSVELALEELDPPQAAELASGLLVEGRSSAKAQAQSIAREAQGNPFFIGELVRYAQMRAELQADPEEFSAQVAGTQTGMAEPSLNDVIRARLSRLSESTRRLLEVVAVAGQPVDLHLAKRAARISSGGHTEIHQLRAAHLVRTRKTEGAEQVEAYHDRIREVAEASLDPELLKQHHHQLATQWEASIQAAPRVLAIHFRGAGIHDKALQYAAEAAQQAEAALAFGGAIEFYRFALEALFNLPQSPERDSRELALTQSIFMALFLTRGSVAPETIDARERIAALAAKSGDLARLVISVLVKGHDALEVGDLAACDAFAEQASELALQEGGPTMIGLAHLLQMVARSARGDLAGVEKHFIAGLKFFIEPGFKQVIGSQDLYAFGTAILNAWMLGRSDVARERVAQMMAAANENNPYELAFSGFWAAALRLLLKEYEQTEDLAAAALELSEKHQFQLLAANSGCILGAARAHLGRTTEGIALIRQGIARLLEAHAKISSCTVFLAVAQERAGNIADALATVEQALQANPEELMNRTGALTLRGELRLKQGQTELAETDFRKAIEVARNMDAKAPELQITMSLAQLLDKQGRRAEARTILADIYGWFTEGFDTADLKDAKALLDEMGH
jgi:tetratricopeptide (TPR) repeat protein